ncbi:MAG: PRC-barrel domain-containing protein [Alphaproteobacteria bacterium]|nr:PRC-barrel domain-containing protein [Alphaproteobacteria bacterium]MBF0355274.1 PRC-barrel domain-containing protein [Alphaproteobacteria bacterium]
MVAAVLFVTPSAWAQGPQQVVSVIDVRAVSSGYRASKVLGANVTNEANEVLGKVDDLIVSKYEGSIYAVLSVGGYLGIGDKLIAVRYEDLRPSSDGRGVMLKGATKEGLKALPEFVYTH